MSSPHDRIMNMFRKQKDEAFYAAFEKHGYSKEWVIDNRERIKIECVSYNHNLFVETTRCYLDGDILFTLTSKVGFDPVTQMANIAFNVEHFNLDK